MCISKFGLSDIYDNFNDNKIPKTDSMSDRGYKELHKTVPCVECFRWTHTLFVNYVVNYALCYIPKFQVKRSSNEKLLLKMCHHLLENTFGNGHYDITPDSGLRVRCLLDSH